MEIGFQINPWRLDVAADLTGAARRTGHFNRPDIERSLGRPIQGHLERPFTAKEPVQGHSARGAVELRFAELQPA